MYNMILFLFIKIVNLFVFISANIRILDIYLRNNFSKWGASFGVRCVVILKITHAVETRNYH